MSQSRVEIKVGLFLLLGLVLLGSLTLLFSRSAALFKDFYEVRLQSSNVGGIKNGAKVLMRGVPVGYVTAAKLNPDGQNVTITLKIEAKYQLYSDAQFAIEQAGFLGDQFVAIYPTADQGYVLTNQAAVVAKEPFNMQEAVAVATEMLLKISETTTNLNAAVSDVRRLVLSETTLRSLNDSLTRFGRITEEAQLTVGNLNALLATNALPVTLAVSNIGIFAEQLPPLSAQAQALLATNATEIHSAIKNFEASSATLNQLMTDLQNGRGAAGRLLRDEQLATNLTAIAKNLSVTTSNLNQRGLWGILWKQKTPPPPKSK
jgi:phospholipid/cholesterol/gamma-HCH transport system substrate-binding protein